MRFIGDVHGKFNKLNEMLIGEQYSVIQVGDLGIGFPNREYPKKFFSSYYFIRGNHDHPGKCAEHPNYLGDYGYKNIQGMDIFYVSGADSYDKEIRTPEYDWWRDEQLGAIEMWKAFDLYKSVLPTVVVSHECPQSIRQDEFGIDEKTATSDLLQNMFEHHKPNVWVFGHHHKKMYKVKHGTTFFGLPELGDLTI